ncbi:hypothetical protein AO9_00880 [Chlamydia psittaci Mat116]|nr:hypothetical protein AO9_00880 [Chlamydia psittaci Mat116]
MLGSRDFQEQQMSLKGHVKYLKKLPVAGGLRFVLDKENLQKIRECREQIWRVLK